MDTIGENAASKANQVEVVERYLSSVGNRDWDEFGRCITDDVVRIGPYGDTYRGRTDYVAFLADLMPRLAGYAMRVDRIVSEGDVVAVELRETVEIDGAPKVTPECLVFDIDPDGRIAKIAIYIRSS
ncbi:MAG TPA: nuclear transport factor 2 family protein [Acidimicrobiales bacterium]|nr:nuclear transport factor 2 family protein [Acidimicrobiales bacterium]